MTGQLTMYHQSPVENRERILRKGLLVTCDRTGMQAVFLSNKPGTTYPNQDVWEVDARGLELEPDFSGEVEGENWFMHFGDIPVSLLKLT